MAFSKSVMNGARANEHRQRELTNGEASEDTGKVFKDAAAQNASENALPAEPVPTPEELARYTVLDVEQEKKERNERAMRKAFEEMRRKLQELDPEAFKPRDYGV